MSATNYYFGVRLSGEIQYTAGLVRWRTNSLDQNFEFHVAI